MCRIYTNILPQNNEYWIGGVKFPLIKCKNYTNKIILGDNMNIKEIRLKAFMTQDDFAKQIGVSISAVRTWEQGVSNPSLKAQKKIVDCCKKNGSAV